MWLQRIPSVQDAKGCGWSGVENQNQVGKVHAPKRFLHQDGKSTEPWERADQCARIHSRRRMPHQEKAREPHNSVGNSTSTDAGTYIPNRLGKGYPPKVFTDPKYSAAQTDTDNDSETDQLHIPFLGDYCQTCISKQSRCTCKPPSDWDADLIDITQPDSPTNDDKGDGHPHLQTGATRKTFGMGRHMTRPGPVV